MSHEHLERLLRDEPEITPSSGFQASVMEAVEREAAAPRPVAFPWMRALPGLVATIAALAVALWHGLGSLSDPAAIAALDAELREIAALAAALGLHWVVFALAITMVSALLPLRLTRVRMGT